MTSAMRSTFDLPATARPTVGDLKMSIVGVDHIGWLLCDGRAASIEEYRTLFAVLGYRFGGSGNTFNLPNPQGRVLGCAGTSTDNTWNIGDASGEETHVLTTNELPPHNHDISGGDPDVSGFTSAELTGITNQTAGIHAHTGVTDPSGSHFHTGMTDVSGTHDHVATSALAGGHNHAITDPGHTHTQTTINDDFNNSGANPPGFTQDSAGTRTWSNINSSITGISLADAPNHSHNITIGINGTHQHAFTTNTELNHVHTFLSDTSGSHTHVITDPTHRHQIASVGDSAPFSLLQPTLFIGNLFVYSGRPFHRITTGDGITIPATYPNIFPYDPDYQVF